MNTIKINGDLYKIIVTNGAVSLRNAYKEIDALNVFPVPDGDTGTNMSMTIEAGVQAIENEAGLSVYEMSKKFSRGMLMGARGNSGVILSQLFRGIYKGLTGYDEVGAKELAKAFKSGVEQAYKAVMKPVEGTILTVAREACDYVNKKVSKKSTINDFFRSCDRSVRPNQM
jgi:dihydroxyacetone kinase-like predicted kinase